MKQKQIRKNKLYYIKHELIGKSIVSFFGFFLIILTVSLVLFLSSKGLVTFIKHHCSPLEFLFSKTWNPERPDSQGGPAIGALIFITGSLLISSLALLIATPFSISTAIFMTEISPKLGRKLLQPAIEIFVGIPSVVYGWIGLSVLVPFIREHIGGLGFSVLAGSLVLSIMIFPTIVSLATDAIKSVPSEYKEASLGLGATRWQTLYKVIVPAATPGILTGIVLGLARAFGEALAVQMVIGNRVGFPKSLLDPSINLTSVLTMEMGNTVSGTLWNDALWSMALLLLLISFAFIFLIRKISSKGNVTK